MATTIHDVLPSNFAYVIFTYIYSLFMIMYLSMKVMGARKKYGVKLAAAVRGAIWVTSRFSYASGYYTGDPEKRRRGIYGYIGYFGLMLLSIATALQLLHVI
ncbi:microsomal glutathione S-transferase 3 [Xenopus laevis]|uniref:Uncharacterized protein n=2 Tax=Xenopus laevis TaxID=8355 RepID=A0A974HW09_XENLA|nr:microsomal glutathione S-transferase 3 [Xenopus laevis]OCT92208.1 hypothetical protein XELAEV_18015264mg [Xenopus laevis]